MKVWKIDCCGDCPSLSNVIENQSIHEYCHWKDKKVKDRYKLPNWCPLEDYNERNTNTKSN